MNDTGHRSEPAWGYILVMPHSKKSVLMKLIAKVGNRLLK
jgi:hypothetical protein